MFSCKDSPSIQWLLGAEAQYNLRAQVEIGVKIHAWVQAGTCMGNICVGGHNYNYYKGRQTHKTCLLPCFLVALRTFPVLFRKIQVRNATRVPIGGLIEIVAIWPH